MERPRILAYLSDRHWCFWTAGTAVVNRIKDDFEFSLGYTGKANMPLRDADLIWCRGQVWRAEELLKTTDDKRRTLFTFTGGDLNRPSRMHRAWKTGKVYLGAVALHAQAEEAAKKMGVNKVWLMPNGVDTKKFKPGDRPKEFTAGFIGGIAGKRRDFHKGYTDLVVPACKAAGVKLIEATDKKNRLSHSKMPAFYRKLTCMVLPTLSEGCSNTVMEGMSTGLPVLVTKTGYHGETCEDGKNILFIKRDVDDIAQKLTWLRDNPKEARHIGKNARKFAEAHDWDIIAERYRKAFWEALEILAQRQAKDKDGFCRVEVQLPISYRGRREHGEVIEDMPLRLAKGFGRHVTIKDVITVDTGMTRVQRIVAERRAQSQ